MKRSSLAPPVRAHFCCGLSLLLLLIGCNALAADAKKLGDALYAAAQQGNQAKITKLLDQGADPNYRTSGWTALLVASSKGHSEVAGILIEAGTDLSLQTDDGWSALHFAAYSGHKSIVESLLNAGSPVDLVNKSGQTALDVAKKRPGIMEMIAAKGGKGQKLGKTLYNAAAAGNLDDVDRLLRSGGSANFHAPDGTPVLNIAAHQGHADVVSRLLEAGADINYQSNSRHTALSMAVQQGQSEVVLRLLDAGANINADVRITSAGGKLNALHIAADRGDAEMAATLLDRGAAVDGTADPLTPPLFYAILKGDIDMARLLIDKGASMGPGPETDQVVTSPLHVAAGSGHASMVEILLQHGARGDLLNAKRQTPLDVAREKGDDAAVRLLDD